ncbi:ras association domain-containing protein 1-like isoform X1 [Petromyzon marinus]|uniref:ras association domain-containing protein 1-like isoform X1 n=2 Tax=Petromyzon marinus TaxID=7757 RepID=UPI003F704A91
MDMVDLQTKEEQKRSRRGDHGKRWQGCEDTRERGGPGGRGAGGGKIGGGGDNDGHQDRADEVHGRGTDANDVDCIGHAVRHRQSEKVTGASLTKSNHGTHRALHLAEGPDSAVQDVEQPGCVLLLSAGADHAAYYSPMGRKGGLRKVESLRAPQMGPQAAPCDLRRQKTTSWLPGSWSSWFSNSGSGGAGGDDIVDSSTSVADHGEAHSKEARLGEVKETALREVEEEDAQEGGHEFRVCAQPTWCDLCGEFMWGVARRSLRCQHCKFSCHQRCQSHIQLECQHGWSQSEEPLLQDISVGSSSEEDPLRPLTPEELRQRIAWYNEQVDNGLNITLHASGRYTGFIRVELKLCRPVSIRGGPPSSNFSPPAHPSSPRTPSPPPTQLPPSPGCDATAAAADADAAADDVFATATSWAPCCYLPKGSSKQLHVGSLTTAREVVRALLRRFAVLDDARKFALFARTQAGGQVRLRKLPDGEKPLYLQLLAGPDSTTLSFLLKENESGDVLWEAFSVPELNNFLRILSREEDEHVRLVLRRYTAYRERLLQMLGGRSPG